MVSLLIGGNARLAHGARPATASVPGAVGLLVAATVVVGLFLAGAMPLAAKVLWQSGLNYVRVEGQNAARGTALPNDHPVRFTAEQIRAMLGGLRIKDTGAMLGFIFDGDEDAAYMPIFGETELDRIAGLVAQGLAEAGPNEDVAVATSGLHRGDMIDFLDETKTTAARIFYQGGRLHVIFSEVQVDYQRKIERRATSSNPKAGGYIDKIDQRKNRPKPGTRVSEARVNWEFKPELWLYYANINGRRRGDWVLIDPEEALKSAQAVPAMPRPAAVIRPVETPRAAPARTAAPSAPVVPTGVTVEEKLLYLRDLFDRGMITEELYLDKAGEILDAY